MFVQSANYTIWPDPVQPGVGGIPEQSTTVSSSTRANHCKSVTERASSANDLQKEPMYESGPAGMSQHSYMSYNPGTYTTSGYTNLVPISSRHSQTSDGVASPMTSPFIDNLSSIHQHCHMTAPELAGKAESNAMEQCHPHGTISCELSNKDLWSKFCHLTTEMIITKQGRRMFPVLQFSLTGLQPGINYSISMEMTLSSNSQWKFQNGKWVPSGQTDTQPPAGIASYKHPDSPNSGSHFLKQTVTFAKMKLTNNKSLEMSGQVVLSSMHKYQPRLLVTPHDGLQETQSFTFPETEFVAVTAYQNTGITQLKIDNNPFAKGFRESATSNSDSFRGDMMMPHPKQMVSKMFVRETDKTYHPLNPVYAADMMKPMYYDNTYRGLANSQRHVAVNTYPGHSSTYLPSSTYYAPRQQSDLAQYTYQPQLANEQVIPYSNTNYQNWYQSANISEELANMHNPTQQLRPCINWLQNSDESLNLRKAFEPTDEESANEKVNDGCFRDDSVSYHSQPNCRKEFWEDCQLTAIEKTTLQKSFNEQSRVSLPQPPALKQCSRTNPNDVREHQNEAPNNECLNEEDESTQLELNEREFGNT